MILYPAIDLKDGKCVRLLRGNMNKSTIFHDKPHIKAKEFEKEGCKWLHVVDLDGAFAGKSINSNAIDEIIGSTSLSVQLGGGIRTLENIDFWLNKGVEKVILGTSAIENPSLINSWTLLKNLTYQEKVIKELEKLLNVYKKDIYIKYYN